jgi:hypothetical protein
MKLDLIPESEIRRIMKERDDARAELALWKEHLSVPLMPAALARIAALEAALREAISTIEAHHAFQNLCPDDDQEFMARWESLLTSPTAETNCEQSGESNG